MSFNHIKGQDRQISILLNALTRGTVAHAYLFTGIPGIGKRTTALAMAKALNCTATSANCGDTCPSCIKITHHAHPDVHWIAPDGDWIKIDQIRKMQSQVSFTLFEGKHKVVILTHAERLNLQASNCLLKTLEEPPPRTTFLLLTSAPYQILPTIRSRCQPIMFQPLSAELLSRLVAEKYAETMAELAPMVSLAGGSLGKIIRWLEEGVAKERMEFFEKVTSLSSAGIADIFSLAESLGEDKENLTQKLDMLIVWIRDLLVFKATGNPRYLINNDLNEAVRSLACKVTWPSLFEREHILHEAQRALQSNVNPRLVMDTMLLHYARGN